MSAAQRAEARRLQEDAAGALMERLPRVPDGDPVKPKLRDATACWTR